MTHATPALATLHGTRQVIFFMQSGLVALEAATGKPQLIIAKTIIGKGIPEVAGTSKGHGEGGAKFADAARKALAAFPFCAAVIPS